MLQFGFRLLNIEFTRTRITRPHLRNTADGHEHTGTEVFRRVNGGYTNYMSNVFLGFYIHNVQNYICRKSPFSTRRIRHRNSINRSVIIYTYRISFASGLRRFGFCLCTNQGNQRKGSRVTSTSRKLSKLNRRLLNAQYLFGVLWKTARIAYRK